MFNPGVMLIRNTAEARLFFARVRRLTNDAKRMEKVRALGPRCTNPSQKDLLKEASSALLRSHVSGSDTSLASEHVAASAVRVMCHDH